MEGVEHQVANVTEVVERKKRKKDRKKSEDDSCVGLQDIHSEAKLSSKTDDESTTNRTFQNGNESAKMSVIVSDVHKHNVSEKPDRKRKKKERARKENVEGDLVSLQQENLPENVEGNIESTECNETAMKKLERKKKHKKEKDYKVDSSAVQQDITMKDSEDNGNYPILLSDEIRYNEAEYASEGKRRKTKIVENGSDKMWDKEVEHSKEGKKRKTKIVENGSDEMGDKEVEYFKKGKKKKTKIMETGSDEMRDNEVEYSEKGKKKKITLVENGSNDLTPNKSNKKVRFSGEDEVFTLPGDSNTENENNKEDNLVRGKRFTREEDEIVKEAVLKYIEEHDLGEEGLNMVLNSSKYPRVRGCWKEIASAIPYRPYTACYLRAQVLFRRSENRKWTQEEYDEFRKYQAEYGNQWRALADALGKHRWHVKDTWRRIKSPDLKKGQWSQNEYQKLFDLVNTDLQLKVSEEKRSKHGMLRDNICWTAISDQLSTRSVATCCLKWYKQLTSPMVDEGVWADTDDYRLLAALYSLDATCMEDVDWDDLLDNRTGDVCRKRWNQMVLHIGRHGNKSFADQVEVLAQRYCPHLLESSEAWDSKPRVP
ncbi:RNA polymerase I termination factor, Myb superfamily [Handroanthus impetiginosus]|uniref:RNA polymerase I termination factor, Myb superfamily n=1 Tax=Handroanthus impetiginosus TaxID=429701 RepID=A0A2G9GRF1_9LAMI|nr:RNA polymerase I termination factor, Myb superfamily [Handroanthus impetiginosus]